MQLCTKFESNANKIGNMALQYSDNKDQFDYFHIVGFRIIVVLGKQ